MTIDGKAIAADLRAALQSEIATGKAPVLGILALSDDAATRSYVRIKEKTAAELGVRIERVALPDGADTDAARSAVAELVEKCDGIIVQLPLPDGIDLEAVLDAVPVTHDVDVLSSEAVARFERGELAILPPVVGAFEEVLRQHDVLLDGKHAVVVGQGRLVGKPAAAWLRQQGASVHEADEHTASLEALTLEADIIVLGAGSPGLLAPEMVRDGAIVLDAGTSESGGKLAGDADPSVATKAGLFTPVPGGIGPIAIAKLFENLHALSKAAR